MEKKEERNIQLLYTEIRDKEDNKDIKDNNNMKSHLSKSQLYTNINKSHNRIIMLIVRVIITLIHLGLHYLI